jgi:CheY-like chemotaxis protein
VIRAVVVSAADLSPDLAETLLYRDNVERLPARSFGEVRQLASGGRPDVVVVDSALPGATALVSALRADPLTRTVAIVALARSEFSFGHLDLLEAGANAILPLPPAADWDDRLIRLVHVPVRKATRLVVDLLVEGGLRGGQRFTARALNLSVNGVLLACRNALEVGDDLRLAFALPRELGSVRATGTVVRTGPTEHCGVEITSVEGDGRVRIKRYVESGLPD